jgi:integrase
MPRRGKRRRLADGVYQDERGIAARVRVGSLPNQRAREKRFPLDTDLKVILRWQLQTRADLMGDLPLKPDRGTLAAAVPGYLATLTGRRRKDAQALLQHWIDSPLGTHPRASITRTQILAQLATWETAGVAASSINHRLLELRALYRELDAEDAAAYNPTLDIRKRREPEPTPRAVPYDLIEAIIAYMPDRGRQLTAGASRPTASQSKARARVMAWTGLPHASLMQLTAASVDFTAKTVYVPRRRKGKGTKARVVPLLPQAVQAFRLMAKWDAWGTFSRDSLRRALRRACERAGVDPIRPYDLRHSFASAAYAASGDIHAVQALLDHSDVKLTARYALAAVDQRVLNTLHEMAKVTRPVTRRKKAR